MTMIKRMDLAWISTNNFEQSKKFFTEVLGLKAVNCAEEYEWMELSGHEGGILLGVGKCDSSSPIQAGQNSVMTMTVENLDEAKTTLEAQGVQFIGEIIEVPEHVKMVFFKDPDKNMFQLVEVLNKN